MISTALLSVSLLAAAPTTQPSDSTEGVPTSQPAGDMIAYGELVATNKMAPMPLKVVMADVEKYTGKQIWIEGTVSDVCAKAGCWMTISGEEGQEPLFIKFTCPIEGRLIPMDAIGQRAVVAGELAVKEITEATARHYAEDAGASKEEIEAIKGPQMQVTMKSPFALVEAN